MRRFLLPIFTLGFIFCVSVSYAQNKVNGIVVDAITNEPLPGAAILEKGTTNAVSAGIDGSFSISLENSPATLAISFIGFVQKDVSISDTAATVQLGVVKLQPNANTMKEVVITSNVAIDRETPVAVSSVSSVQIAEKAGQQEFPELLKSTPGVYATKAGGGYGDSRINLRGFQSANIAVMINGVPVNDMESGRVFWSNWAGLTDVTRSMQVQRGLGASKVAVPSVGGTINIITKTTDATKGGFIYQGFGNNEYNKTAFSYSSGLTEKGWAFSVAGSKSEGNGWAEGLQYEAYNYFFNVSKNLNKNHTLSLTGFGAPQYHSQRFDRLTIQQYRDAPQGIKFNPNWGVLNGDFKTISGNFYHKPQVALNHNWTIDESSFLSTAVYASIGKGGNEFDGGSILFDDYKTGGFYSPINLDAIVDLNVNSPDGNALGYLQSNRNDHIWYGALSTYQKQLNEKFNLLGGLDLRYYKGIHYNSVKNLLGAEYVLNGANVNNPQNRAKTGDKIGFYNDGLVLWEGAFLQGEYKAGPLSAFISLAASNTSYKRIDYFKYADNDPLRESDYQHFFGYQTKGGANYNLDQNHNVFANVGYFEKAPFFDVVFQGNQNVPSANPENEKILSYELGYGYRSSMLSANVNLYRTNWKDRGIPRSLPGQGGSRYYYTLLGVDALHQGIEIDFKYQPIKAVSITGMASLGDWRWQNDLDQVTIFDENQVQLGTVGPIYMGDLKVGDAAQTTVALGLNVNVTNDIKLGADYNYYGNY
ncbi:MAG: TonB-dependent receptor, partial [Sphingobacteriaceae bacterium]